ncbi:MAG: T9SS type A sorting domain-containing protein [Calditrichaeota bacterium]|nr:T9SS type A sorting domain-containing protein [Calditrichota bacterium]
MQFKQINILIMCVIVVTTIGYSSDQTDVTGITVGLDTDLKCVAYDPAVMRVNDKQVLSVQPDKAISPLIQSRDEWLPLDASQALVSIPAGDRYTLRLDPAHGSIEEVMPENILNDYCMDAVASVPRWIRSDLINNLNRIGGEWADFAQEQVADIILETDDILLDEVAFVLAHISPVLLENFSLNLDLFVENAEGIYEADEYLDYVEIVEHGSVDEGDWWTSLEYLVKVEVDSAQFDTIRVELDRDLYYWYVVHPRLFSEMPLYINPGTGGSARPPNGKFWRDFFLNEPDDDYLSLRESIEDCGVLWSNLRNNGTDENGAIGMISWWVQHVLDFTSRQERPAQPVRIYDMHIGRCGEHSYLTSAAGRAALIPTICTSTICTDHVWNEFWDGERWITWEPVNNYIDSAPYDNWNQIPGVANWRSDSYAWDVTERYTACSDLEITITDRNRKPVDGAEVRLASEYLHGGYQWCGYGYTNADGEVSFKVGDNRNIYLRVESSVGNYPNDGITRIISSTEADQVYEWSRSLNGSMPSVSADDAEEPDDPSNHYHLDLTYELKCETTNGSVTWRTNTAEYFVDIADARLDFFICDQENYELYIDGDDFEAFNAMELDNSGERGFDLPTDEIWYAVFSNDNRSADWMKAEITATFSVDSEYGIDNDVNTPFAYKLYQNYPNPFNSHTQIAYSTEQSGRVYFSIYDLSGRCLLETTQGNLKAGRHGLMFNAGDLTSGTYLYELRSGSFVQRKSMTLIR